ncbi:MAG: hypothetical protein QOD99_3119 [Chthoniobacter sp.]|nr:hypothetical protein [Chthoniobacter sp.]
MSKINLPIAELKPALTGLGKIISKRSILPVLGCIKVDRTKEGWVVLTSTDIDSFITVRLEEPAEGAPVSILVPYDDVTRITKRCQKNETISIEKAAGDKALISFPIGNQTAQEHVESLAVAEFPPVPKIKSDPVAFNNDIRSSLLEAFQCASTDETRLILNGAYIDVSKKECHQIVGTDGRHLFASNSFTLALKESLIIPSHKFLGWKEFSIDGEWQLRVQQPEKKDEIGLLQISSRRWRFITRQIEGIYPNWRQVIPREDGFKSTVEFEQAAVKDLVQTIDRLPCVDKINQRVGIKVTGRKISFIGQTEGQPVSVEITEATGRGSDVVIYLNRNIVGKALGFGLFRMQITDGLSPARFSDDAGRQIIVMPIRPDGPPPTVSTATAKTTADPEPNGDGEAEPVNSEASPERNTDMPKTTSTNGNGHQATAAPKPALESAIDHIESIKTSLRAAKDGLNDLFDCLKQVQREQKTTEREVQSVRTTLEKLQQVRI